MPRPAIPRPLKGMMAGMMAGMMGRIALVLMGAIVLELLGIVALHQWQDRELVDAARTQSIARQLADAVRIAETAPRPRRAGSMHDLAARGPSRQALALNWVPNTVITDHSAANARLAAMRARLVQADDRLRDREMRLSLMLGRDGGQHDLVGLIALDDGSFLSFRVNRYLRGPPPLWLVSLLHILLLVAVFGLAMVLMRALLRPLRDLAMAADETGRDHTHAIVPDGPREVRQLAHAFSAMQVRLIAAMDDNTQALIAVSHDLRTPIQRAKLRAAMLDDAAAGAAIEQELAAMDRFIDGALAYVRSGADEEPRLIDVAAMLAAIADDTADQGADIRFRGPPSLILHTRPILLARMLQNLIDNARRYANRIELRLTGEANRYAEICVDDDGPGIPAEQRADALQPFRKLTPAGGEGLGADGALNQGAGLGLAFIQRAMSGSPDGLMLEDSPLGGLRARLTLHDAGLSAEQGPPG
ncbi:ATP-binding protein [Tsuneonella suprasediminis]|uniref:ATP-binding protein n=1 Tax=Tsuneonella suprasediminis TaxID=2306996 RepID=UPI002F91F1E8